MPRPRTTRRIRTDLLPQVFVPSSSSAQPASQQLTLDGLEALRLADLEGLYQEEAARRMGVSRATFARVLAGARSAVADALVNGKAVEIGGGTVEQAKQPGSWPCPVHGGQQRRGRGCLCTGSQSTYRR
jgi:predicted DNA-binding protein (UPF0251 family)